MQNQYTVSYISPAAKVGPDDAEESWNEQMLKHPESVREALEGFYDTFWKPAFMAGGIHVAKKLGFVVTAGEVKNVE